MSKTGTRRSNGEGSIRKKGEGRYEARYTDPFGKRRSISGTKEKDVRAKLTAIMASIDNGAYSAPDKITVTGWVERWLWEYKKRTVADTTFDDYFRMWKLYIDPSIGTIPLQKLRGDQVQVFVNNMADEEYSAATINLAFAVLNQALKKAFHLDLIRRNPATGAELPKADKKEPVILSADEQKKFVEVAANSDYGHIFLLMLCTGMRPGETLGLKWSEVDLVNGLLSVKRTMGRTQTYDDDHNVSGTVYELKERTKTSSGRRELPLIPESVELLKQIALKQKIWKLKTGSSLDLPELVCAGPDGTVPTSQYLNYLLKAMLDKAELPIVSPHKLRHTFATRGLENGVDMRVMQEMLGHATMAETSDTYSHVLPNKLRAEMNKMTGSI